MLRCGSSALRLGRPSQVGFQLRTAAAITAEIIRFDKTLPNVPSSKPAILHYPRNVQTSHLENGIRVISAETGSATTCLSVGVKAGSRFEASDEIGAAHVLRRVAFKSAGDRSVVHMARMPELLGGNLWATSGREAFVYNSTCLKDNVEEMMNLLTLTVAKPAFHHWEVRDSFARIETDIKAAALEPDVELMEAMHAAAYRNTLRNPLFCPMYRLGEIDDFKLRSYHERRFTGPQVVVAAAGIPHEDLVVFARQGLGSLAKTKPTDTSAQFTKADQEVRLENGNSVVSAALVTAGASYGSSDYLVAGVLQRLLGVRREVQHGAAAGRLFQSVAKTRSSAQVEAINFNYTDSGLFGVFAKTSQENLRPVLKSLVGEVARSAETISAGDLARAKALLTSHLGQLASNNTSLVDELLSQTLLAGQYRPVESLAADITKITAAQVKKFAMKLLTQKRVLVVNGNLTNAPYLDELR